MPKRTLTKIRLSEISAVDRPAQARAEAVIAKNVGLTSSEDGHTHTLTLKDARGELNSGYTSYSYGSESPSYYGHEHQWIRTESGEIVIGEAHGHTHTIDQISKADGHADTSEPVDRLDKGKKNKKDDKDKRVRVAKKDPEDEPRQPEDEPMAMTEQEQAAMKRLEDIVGLPADQRAYFDTLTKADQDAFLATDMAKRAEQMTPAYESADGTKFYKSDDPRLIEMAKKADSDSKAREAIEKRYRDSELKKRAGDLTDALPGDENVRVAIIEAVDGIEDEEVRKSALETLASKNKAMRKGMSALGTTADDPDDVDGETDFDALVKKYRKDNPEATELDAVDAVAKSAEGRRARLAA